MSYTLTFSNGCGGQFSISVNRPQYGYEAQVHLQIVMTQVDTGSYSFWDNGIANDYRTCNTAKWLLPASQKALLNAFFREATHGRAETIAMALGNTPTGFFPFGPDLGDVGTFVVQAIARKQGGMLYKPYKYFDDEFDLLMIAAPGGYSLPSQITQGKFQIGTVGGLRYPGFAPKSAYAFETSLTRNGTPKSIDLGSSADSWETSFSQTCNQSKAAALASYLSAIRDGTVTLTAPASYYPFGIDPGADGAFSTKFLGSKSTSEELILSITHDAFNQFTIPLNFWMEPD